MSDSHLSILALIPAKAGIQCFSILYLHPGICLGDVSASEQQPESMSRAFLDPGTSTGLDPGFAVVAAMRGPSDTLWSLNVQPLFPCLFC